MLGGFDDREWSSFPPSATTQQSPWVRGPEQLSDSATYRSKKRRNVRLGEREYSSVQSHTLDPRRLTLLLTPSKQIFPLVSLRQRCIWVRVVCIYLSIFSYYSFLENVIILVHSFGLLLFLFIVVLPGGSRTGAPIRQVVSTKRRTHFWNVLSGTRTGKRSSFTCSSRRLSFLLDSIHNTVFLRTEHAQVPASRRAEAYHLTRPCVGQPFSTSPASSSARCRPAC